METFQDPGVSLSFGHNEQEGESHESYDLVCPDVWALCSIQQVKEGKGGLPEPVSSAPRVWLAGHQEEKNNPYGKVIRGLPFRNGLERQSQVDPGTHGSTMLALT